MARRKTQKHFGKEDKSRYRRRAQVSSSGWERISLVSTAKTGRPSGPASSGKRRWLPASGNGLWSTPGPSASNATALRPRNFTPSISVARASAERSRTASKLASTARGGRATQCHSRQTFPSRCESCLKPRWTPLRSSKFTLGLTQRLQGTYGPGPFQLAAAIGGRPIGQAWDGAVVGEGQGGL